MLQLTAFCVRLVIAILRVALAAPDRLLVALIVQVKFASVPVSATAPAPVTVQVVGVFDE